MTQPESRSEVLTNGPSTIGENIRSAVVVRLQKSELFHEYQQAFEATTGLPLVLRDVGSMRTPMQGSKRLNPFCALMVRANKTCAACLQLQQRLEDAAQVEPKTLECYAGLSESAVPVRVGSQIIGYLQTGQVFLQAPSKRTFRTIAHLLPGRKNRAGPRELEAAYFATRVFSEKQYGSIIRLLGIFARHLATVSNELLIRERTIESPAITRSRTFIAEHHGDALSLGDVAHAANMSAFYFCKVFRKSTGLSFVEYLARERIEAVKRLLLNDHTRVSEAGYAAGFQSLSQFNRVFRRIVGEAPSRYRERLHRADRRSPRVAVVVRAA